MADLVRPEYGTPWASEGEIVAPTQDKVELGWVQEMMPFQWENYLQNRQDSAITYLLQKGIPEYSNTQEYIAQKSAVLYMGAVYIATQTVTGVLPTVTASWKRISPILNANGTVSVTGGGTGATTAEQARTNLGLGSASTATLPSTTGVVIKGSDNALISRLLTGTAGDIVVTNPDGVAGNINIGVGSNVAKTNQDSSWTSKGGITLPKGSSSERGVEVPGKIRYNTELQKFEGYDGTSWNALGATSEVEITTLSGDGITTSFTLTAPAFSETSTDVYIGGVWQNKGTYNVSGSTITFSEAPTPGIDNIQVVSRRVVDLGATTASQVSIQDTSNYYTATTVEGALREVGEDFAKLTSYTGAISADAEWSDVPAHSDSAFDVQALALANRTEMLMNGVGGYSKIREYAGNGTRLKVQDQTGVHWWARRGSAADDGGTALKDALDRSWEREYSGAVNAKWFATINDAVNNHDKVYVPYDPAGYEVTEPIYLSAGKSIFSDLGTLCQIRKEGNALGTGSNTYGSATDSYEKDAVVIVTHPDNAYATYIGLENIQLISAQGGEHVIYAPRIYVSQFDNVVLTSRAGKFGFVTHDAFMCSFRDVQAAATGTMQAGSVAFWWDDLGRGASGTSCSFDRVWARDGWHTAYKARGLNYSTFTACGADKYIDRAIDFDLCEITINGMGMENRTAAGASPIKLRYSRINLNSVVVFSVSLLSDQFLIDAQGGQYSIKGFRHTAGAGGALGSMLRAADSAVVNHFGFSTNLTNPAISIESSGTVINDTSSEYRGANNSPKTFGGKFSVATSDGNELGYLSNIFGTATRLQSAGALYLGASGNATLYLTETVFRPYSLDNAIDLGAASQRYKTLYAGTGTINTSDEREKQQIRELTDTERAVAVRLKSLIRAFKFNDAVEKKGGNARTHVGVIAQDVKVAFESEGLDAFKYGILCYDEWDEQPEVVETWGDEFDGDGNLIRTAGSKVTEAYRPAGNRYGVRYEELLAFIIGAI